MTAVDDLYARAIGQVRAYLKQDVATADAGAPVLVERLFDVHKEIEDVRRAEEAARTATPAQEWGDRFKQTRIREISRGRSVELRSLSLSGEILRGSLPNAVLQSVIFDDTPEEERDVNYWKQRFEGYRAIAARALVVPRLVVTGEPDRGKGEIGIDDLTFIELQNIYYYSVQEVVPPVADAPFPAGKSDGQIAGGPGRPGKAVQRDAEQLPGTGSADG